MKKVLSLLFVFALLTCLAPLAVSAEDYIGGAKTIPYAVKAPKLDGDLSDWKNAAKFGLPASAMKLVGEGNYPQDMFINTYMMWDETYLYMASEVKDTDGGRLWYGAAGDILHYYFDVNGLCEANGNPNMHNFNISVFPVVSVPGGNDVTGLHTRYNGADHDHAPDNAVLADAAGSGSGDMWRIEYRIKWTDMAAMFAVNYSSVAFPEIGEGTVLTFAPSYEDCITVKSDDNVPAENIRAAWLIGTKDHVSLTPGCFGFKGTLGAKPAPTPGTPDTADAVSVCAAILVLSAGAVIAAAKAKKH